MTRKINIDLNYYVTFYYVAKHGSFSLAAKELKVSQPAVSYSISELEKALNVSLFIRKGKKIELTKSGEVLLDYVDECFNTITLAEDRITSDRGDFKIAIGIQSHLIKALPQIGKIVDVTNEIRFSFIDDTAENLLSKLEHNEIEIAVIAGDIDFKDYDKIKLKELNMAFIYKDGYVNIKENKGADALNNYKVALPLPSTKARREISAILLQKNIRVNPTFEFNSNQMCISLMNNVKGIYYIPAEMVWKDVEKGKLKILDVGFSLPKIPVYVVFKEKYISPTARKVIDKIVKND